MGTENMGPLLHSLVRFCKPRTVVEVGAGYSSIFLLQALADNVEEMTNYQRLDKDGAHTWPFLNWLVERVVHDQYHWGRLVCIDSMEHARTTAHLLAEVAEGLGLSDMLDLVEGDAFGWAKEQLEDGDGDAIDLLWLDFGDGDSLEEIIEKFWPLVAEQGGRIVVHSTLTNTASRAWLASMKERAKEGTSPLGLFEMSSLLEPHKMRQNSCTLIQRRGYLDGEYSEPIHTKYC